MNQNKLKGSAKTNYDLSGRDFGDPKLRKEEFPRPKMIYIQDDSNLLKCKSCGKRNYIPSAPITETKIMYCNCGQKLAILAGKDYGEKQRKLQIAQAAKAILDEEIESQIIKI